MLSNYRPISIIPLISKVFEKCMYKRLIKFFTWFNVLPHQKFGFKRGKSCGDAVGQLLDFVYSAINDKKYLISIFLELRKAYDTVNHNIFLDR